MGILLPFLVVYGAIWFISDFKKLITAHIAHSFIYYNRLANEKLFIEVNEKKIAILEYDLQLRI